MSRINDRVGDIIETDIRDLAYDGKSVGTNQGKIVFLNGGLPGERVRAEIVKTKSKFAVGKVLEITHKSDKRVAPECSHFEICGGCTWQDLDYETQLYYKRKQVVDCIEHIGKLKDVVIDDTVPSLDKFYYRNKMEYSFNVDETDGFTLGLHHRGRFDRIFNLENCYLESEKSNEIVRFFQSFVREKNIPVYHISEHTGFIRFLMIREAKLTGQIMVNIVTVDGEIPYIDELIASLTRQVPEIKTIVQNVNNQKSNIAKGEYENILYGPGYIEEEILSRRFRVYANSFFQTNSRQSEVLYGKAFDFLRPEQDDILIDLYCGTGTIGICASGNVASVTGIDIEPSAIIAAKENAGLNNIENVNFITGSVQDIMRDQPEVFGNATCAVIDPPRSGLHPKALKGLIRLDLPKVIYVSCNPATFARDAAALTEAGYELEKVIPVDMFPHTMHIELVSGFYRK